MIPDEQRRGVLYPARLPEFHRLPAPDELAHAVRWVWIPEWALPPGQESRQDLLPFPACNLVVEAAFPAPPADDEPTSPAVSAIVAGPATRRSARVLSGRGWAVGALLRPAAAPALLPSPGDHRDSAIPLDAPELLAPVVRAMTDRTASPDARRAAAASALLGWIAERVPAPAERSDAALANALEAAAADPGIIRVDDLAERLHVSVRTAQRIAERYIGVTPHALIRRRRLQEAAERLRTDPELALAALAAELGYADHAHFASDFKAVLGVPPSAYRAAAVPHA